MPLCSLPLYFLPLFSLPLYFSLLATSRWIFPIEVLIWHLFDKKLCFFFFGAKPPVLVLLLDASFEGRNAKTDTGHPGDIKEPGETKSQTSVEAQSRRRIPHRSEGRQITPRHTPGQHHRATPQGHTTGSHHRAIPQGRTTGCEGHTTRAVPQGSHHRFTQLRDSHRVTPQGHTTGPHHRVTTGQEPLESNRSTAVLEAASLRTLTMRPTTETTRGSFHRSVKCCSGNTIPSGNNTKQNNDSSRSRAHAPSK